MATIYNQGKTALPNNPFYVTGKHLQTVQSRLSVTVATAAVGDLYVLAEGLSLASRIHKIVPKNTSGTLTAATSNDVGFYKYNSAGALVPVNTASPNVLVAAADYSAGLANGVDLLAGLTDLKARQSIGALLGLGVDAEPIGGVVLALRTNVAPTTNNRVLDIETTIEEATR